MYSIAARRAHKRVCPLQPHGMLSRGTHAYPGANGYLTPLSPLHVQLLRHLHLPPSLYTALADNAS